MSRETEFLTRHKEDLCLAAEICRILQRNAIEARPRELNYLRLMGVCKRLEGSCRQMAHERGDDFTWLQLGYHYANVAKTVQKLRRGLQWMQFGELAKVFEVGLVRVDTLAHTATGVTSMNSSPLLILPRYLQTKQASGIVLP